MPRPAKGRLFRAQGFSADERGDGQADGFRLRPEPFWKGRSSSRSCFRQRHLLEHTTTPCAFAACKLGAAPQTVQALPLQSGRSNGRALRQVVSRSIRR